MAGADDPLIGRLAGSYQIAALLGAGGMGKVYRARHPTLGREAAVKVLALGLTGDADLVRRFKVEAQAVGRLQHPNIVEVLDFGTLEDGRPFYIMEFLRGESLAHYLSRVGRLGAEGVVAILDPVLSALEAAHAAGVIHRDLKPENVFLVARDGGYVPKLLDFGVAKLTEPGASPHTQTGSLLGTPAYMSPEQAAGQTSRIGPPSDLYSVGVMAYEMLTGRPPFQAAHLGELIHKHLVERPSPLRELRPDLPAELEELLAMTLAKDPAERPQSAVALRNALRSIAAPQPITVVEFGTPVPLRAAQGTPPVRDTPPTRIAQGSGRSAPVPAQPQPEASAQAEQPQPLATTQRTRAAMIGPAMAVIAAMCAAAAVAVVLVRQGKGGGTRGVAAAVGVDAGLAAAPAVDAGVQVVAVTVPPDTGPPDAGVSKSRAAADKPKAAKNERPKLHETPKTGPGDGGRPPQPGDDDAEVVALIKESKESLGYQKYDKARDRAVEALKKAPGNQEAIYLAGHASCFLGDEPAAKKYYGQLSDGRAKAALDDVCARWKGIYLTPTSKGSPADRSGRVMEMYPKAVELMVKDPAKAYTMAEEIIALQPDFEGGYIVLAGSACRLGKLDVVKKTVPKVRPAMHDVIKLNCDAAKQPWPFGADAGP